MRKRGAESSAGGSDCLQDGEQKTQENAARKGCRDKDAYVVGIVFGKSLQSSACRKELYNESG